MNEAVIKVKLLDLHDTMNGLSILAAGKAQPPCQTQQPGQTTEEILDNLRLQVRYLVFDIEATRRENKYLRQMLESRPRPGTQDADGQPPF